MSTLLEEKADFHQLQLSLGTSAVGVVNSPVVAKALARIDAMSTWEYQASRMGGASGDDEGEKISEEEFVRFCAEGRAIGVSVQSMRPVMARLQDSQRWIHKVRVRGRVTLK